MKLKKFKISYFDPTQDGAPTYTEEVDAIDIQQVKERFEYAIIISLDEIN